MEYWVFMHKIIDATGFESWPDHSIAMFYAEAWALVHYLMTGRKGEDPFDVILRTT